MRRHATESWPPIGLAFVALLSLTPLIFEQPSIRSVADAASVGGSIVVVSVMLLTVAAAAWGARRQQPEAFVVAYVLLLLTAWMTASRDFLVDGWPHKRAWQVRLYLEILDHQGAPPHQFRPLPYGFVRTLEWCTGSWILSCTAYRGFFTYWFLWSSYLFARQFHEPGRALLPVLAVTILYPLSVFYYYGQLTDPLSHALFMIAVLWVVEDRWIGLAAALTLGVMAKETVVLLVPVYWVCHFRQGWPAFAKSVGLGVVSVAAFLAVRLPLGWEPGHQDLNGLSGLMIGSNLGFGHQVARTAVPIYQNYLHPLWFVGVFLPLIALCWRSIDSRLKVIALTLTPLLLLSNLCFGWMYESRNYMPIVPILATMAIPIGRARQ